jgi:hypothetical protein
MSLIPRLSVLLLGGVLLAGTAGLTVKKTSVEELTASSQLVLHARVGSSSSQWEDKNIYTYTQLEVIEPIKGSPPERVTVKQLGGRVGQEAYWVHSIVLGKFSVERAEGRVVAVNDLNNVGLIDPATGREITDAADKRNAVPLDLLKRQIRTYIIR